MGLERVSAFMGVLPARGISGVQLGKWRTAIEEFEMSLGKAAGRRVGPEDVEAYIGEMSPQKMGMLPQSERLAVMDVMQQNAMPQLSATRSERRTIREPTPIYYVEVNVRGKAPGLLGGSDFDFSNHLAVGEDLAHDTR